MNVIENDVRALVDKELNGRGGIALERVPGEAEENEREEPLEPI